MKIHQYVQNSLLLAINSGYGTIWRDLNSKLKDENCNLLQALILISIFFEPAETVIPSKLAQVLNATRGNISHNISDLEKKGYLKRALDERDARSYRLVLQPEGKKTAVKLIKVVDELEKYFENRFGKETINEMIRCIGLLEVAYRNKMH